MTTKKQPGRELRGGLSRYIWCLDCREGVGLENEPDTLKLGAVRSSDVFCDRCGEYLPKGVDAVAVSFWNEPEAYRPWEHEYLVTLEPEPQIDERPSGFPGQGEADGRSSEPTPGKVGTHETEWTVISTYTRRQAIADGVLIDVTPTAREAGFRYPVAVTCGVWAECIAVPAGVEWQDEAGRLWDVLSMLVFASRQSTPEPLSEIRYKLHVQNDDRDGVPPLVELVAVCGPDDDGSPCVTIMLPGED